MRGSSGDRVEGSREPGGSGDRPRRVALRRRHAGILALVLLALGAPAAALGGSESRQTVKLRFTTERPDRPAGLRLSIDYVNPDDPGAKPPAVRKVVEILQRGARIDTSAPRQCKASDGELIAMGEDACPAASKVGSGQIDLDTGAPGPSGIVKNDVTFFNNEDELIFLTRSTNTPTPVRAVVRSVVERRRVINESPPLPGVPPPDPFAAIKRVRVKLDRVTRGRRSYITTPSSCPQRGRWVNRVRFTYRDEVTQTVRSASPCRSAAPAFRRTELRRRGR